MEVPDPRGWFRPSRGWLSVREWRAPRPGHSARETGLRVACSFNHNTGKRLTGSSVLGHVPKLLQTDWG